MSERKLWNVTERSHSITLKYYARSLPFSGGHKEVGKRKCLLDFSILGFRLCDELWRQCITEGMESKIATAAPNHEQRPVSALTFRTASSQWSSRSKELPSLNAAYNSTVDDQEERDAASIHPQTREGGAATTTSDINNVSFSEYEDLLVLAQQQFGDLRRTFKQNSTLQSGAAGDGHRPASKASRSVKKGDNKVEPVVTSESKKSNQLLSTLLYLSLMMNKVEEIKSILKQVDAGFYDEWNALFTALHPPLFHIRERRMQNDRAKRIYKRKAHYKNQSELCDAQLKQQKDVTSKMQKQASDTAQQMSTTISRLMEEIAVVRNQLSSKQQVELELSKTNREVEILRARLEETEREYAQVKAEMQDMVLRYEATVKEATESTTTVEQTKSKGAIERLTQCHQEALKEVTGKTTDYKNKSKLLEEQLEQQMDVMSKLQDQANDTAQQMSASISRLMEETVALRNQLSSKQQVELELSKANREADVLRARLEETECGYVQSNAEMQKMIRHHQEALREATEKTSSAYTRASTAETELKATKEALVTARKQRELSKAECSKALAQARDLMHMQEKANKLENELMETKNILTDTHKDLNYAKDALAKALPLHAGNSKNEIKLEETLQEVGWLSLLSISARVY